ncbi:MAG: hypothetical protein U0942_13180 [Parvibaculum sp.]|jgi:KDO2-lipid IV(A) lauroyltransferase|uniref:lysophospholipid acyltransferase family protein n=1 Tax=Parvibaculum sp. TaxID=2024848 RepID=UPI002AB9734B|nr:hypothetical protein [Parvibaculum sp.]MDZ4382284.1 hypothetical protein [Parvibaculum sp.]
MARKGTFIHLLEYAVLKATLAFFGAMNVDRASDAGGWIGRNIGMRLPFTNRARDNIALVLPDLTREERERVVTGMWDNLGRTIAEYAHLEVFAKPEERHRIEVVHAETLRALAASGNGGIVVSGHFANWEILPVAMQFEDLDGGEVYRHANNPYVNEWMIGLRERVTRAVQVPKGGPGARTLVKLLREDKFIAMLVDQKMNDGIEAKLFGHRAMTTGAPAGLSVRYNVPIFPACIERVKGAHFRVTVYNPIAARPGADAFEDVMRITQELNDFLEERIRERPHEWLWLHNRWTKQRPARRRVR